MRGLQASAWPGAEPRRIFDFGRVPAVPVLELFSALARLIVERRLRGAVACRPQRPKNEEQDLQARAFDQPAAEYTQGTLRRLPLITLYLTDRCNSRCVTCDYWRHGRADMNLESVTQLLPSLVQLQTRVVLISGGEP